MTERVHIEKRYGPRRETTSPVEDRDGAAQIRGKISLFLTFIPCPSISSTIFWTSPNSFRMDQNFLNIHKLKAKYTAILNRSHQTLKIEATLEKSCPSKGQSILKANFLVLI